MRLHPFAALRPPPELASRVASVPYDVVNADEARVIAQAEGLSFMHVLRPEVDLPPDLDPHDDQVYSQARTAFQKLPTAGVIHFTDFDDDGLLDFVIFDPNNFDVPVRVGRNRGKLPGSPRSVSAER